MLFEKREAAHLVTLHFERKILDGKYLMQETSKSVACLVFHAEALSPTLTGSNTHTHNPLHTHMHTQAHTFTHTHNPLHTPTPIHALSECPTLTYNPLQTHTHTHPCRVHTKEINSENLQNPH